MSENARPRGGGGAADDVLSALSGRVRELQTRLAGLQSDLDEAQRRLATYEEFDTTLQDALSGALRAAHEIRTRAEETAQQLLEQAREERRVLMKEVQRLRDERDALQEEIATVRRGGIAPVPRPVEAPSAADLKAAAAEAMRSIFDEIVEEMRGRVSGAPERPAPAPRPAQTVPQPQPAPAAPAMAAPQAPPERPPMRPVAPPPPSTPTVTATPPAPAPPAQMRPATPPAPAAAPMAPAAPPRRADDLTAALAKQFEPPRAPLAEPPRPTAVTPSVAQPTAAADASGASMEIQLVLSPVPSFPRLVEIERRIQSLPSVRTLYVRDFRNGVATLAVGLRSAMTGEEFASSVQTIDGPRFHLENVARNSVELRIDGEAATA